MLKQEFAVTICLFWLLVDEIASGAVLARSIHMIVFAEFSFQDWIGFHKFFNSMCKFAVIAVGTDLVLRKVLAQLNFAFGPVIFGAGLL